MEEALIFGLILCGIVSAIGIKLQYPPVVMFSSIGLAVVGLKIYQEQESLLNLALIIAVAAFQLFIPKNRMI